jgi:hypothetical protein
MICGLGVQVDYVRGQVRCSLLRAFMQMHHSARAGQLVFYEIH